MPTRWPPNSFIFLLSIIVCVFGLCKNRAVLRTCIQNHAWTKEVGTTFQFDTCLPAELRHSVCCPHYLNSSSVALSFIFGLQDFSTPMPHRVFVQLQLSEDTAGLVRCVDKQSKDLSEDQNTVPRSYTLRQLSNSSFIKVRPWEATVVEVDLWTTVFSIDHHWVGRVQLILQAFMDSSWRQYSVLRKQRKIVKLPAEPTS